MATAIDELPRVTTTDRKPILSARHVTHVFGEGSELATVLDDVSIDLFASEFVLLMGPSGSGKTTLLAIISGLLRPTAGQVVVLGQDLWAMSETERAHFRLRHCGFVFQEYNLLPTLNARQQLEIVLRWGEGVSAAEAKSRAERVLASLDLARKGALMPTELSGGEQQRVAIGRGLVKNPAFCFADEPTAALDWKRGEQVVALLRHAAHDMAASVFVAAHDERIAPYADRVFELEDGKLRVLDPASLTASGAEPMLAIAK